MNLYKIILGALLVFIFVSCTHHKTKEQAHSANHYEVIQKPLHKTVHFTGTIQPIHENTLTSPMDAVMDVMHVHYGQRIKKGDVVFTLNSNELQKQYNDTLTEYLKAKDTYTLAKAKFSGTQDLWDSGLISKNNYISEKSNIENARMTLMQSTRKLTETLEKMDEGNPDKISSLTLSDFDKVKAMLTSRHNLIRIKSPNDGVLLYPPKSGDDKTTRITVGSSIKSGQVLALVGDLTGVSIEIDIPEIDIEKVHTGMRASISGVAFGRHQLQGTLVAINAQASNAGNGLPSFTGVVEVHHLTKEQQPWIKVGMSASIELNADSKNQLVIPIAAVKREMGHSFVLLQLADGTLKKQIITTGAAQMDLVVVESGLKAGDVVVYD